MDDSFLSRPLQASPHREMLGVVRKTVWNGVCGGEESQALGCDVSAPRDEAGPAPKVRRRAPDRTAVPSDTITAPSARAAKSDAVAAQGDVLDQLLRKGRQAETVDVEAHDPVHLSREDISSHLHTGGGSGSRAAVTGRAAAPAGTVAAPSARVAESGAVLLDRLLRRGRQDETVEVEASGPAHLSRSRPFSEVNEGDGGGQKNRDCRGGRFRARERGNGHIGSEYMSDADHGEETIDLTSWKPGASSAPASLGVVSGTSAEQQGTCPSASVGPPPPFADTGVGGGVVGKRLQTPSNGDSEATSESVLEAAPASRARRAAKRSRRRVVG